MAVPEQKIRGLTLSQYNSVQWTEQASVVLKPCLHLHSFNNLDMQRGVVGTHAHPAQEIETSNLKKCLLSTSVLHWK